MRPLIAGGKVGPRELTKDAGQLDAGRGRKEAISTLLSGVTGRVVDDIGRRVRQDGRRDPGSVQVVEGVLASRVGAVPRGTLEAVDALGHFVPFGRRVWARLRWLVGLARSGLAWPGLV